MSEETEDAKRVRLSTIARDLLSLPEPTRAVILQSLSIEGRTIIEQLLPSFESIPLGGQSVAASINQPGARMLSLSADQLKDLCQNFLSVSNWPYVNDVDLERVKLKKDNGHSSKVFKSGLRQNPEKPGTPIMLLYKLLDDNKKVFSKGETLYGELWSGKLQAHHIILLGPSGCGKTRKLLELMVKKFGYYLLASSVDDRNHGSSALYDALSVPNLRDIFPSTDVWTESNTEFDKRRRIVEFSVKCVLLSYAMVYRLWNEWLQKKKAKPVSPKAWLLVQLFPRYFLKRDMFSDLTLMLMRRLPFGFDFPPALFPNDFVCAIDDAQVLGDHLINRFESERRNSLSSALSPILRATRHALGTNVILSGTGLSMLKATIWKSHESNMATTNVTAERFIFCDFQPLTPEDVVERLKELVNYQGSDLAYVAHWLTGRPLFLATFLEIVIEKSYDISHYVQQYVGALTASTLSRTPASYLARLADEPAEPQLGGEPAPNLYSRFLLSTYWMSNGPNKLIDANASLVELGLSYASTNAVAEPLYIQSTIFVEPLILEAARHRRQIGAYSLEQVAISNLLNGMNAKDRGKRIEYVVADRLSSVLFGQERPLQECELFCQKNAVALPETIKDVWCAPEWCFGQVAVTEPDNTLESRIGFYAWMVSSLNPQQRMIRVRFPSDSAGPDVIFVVRNKAMTKVLPVFVQIKFDRTPDPANAFHTVDPDLLHHQNREKNPTIIDELRRTHEQLIKRLTFPILRVVVSSKTINSSVSKIRLVPFNRGGQMGHDVCVFLDKSENEKVFGKKISDLIEIL